MAEKSNNATALCEQLSKLYGKAVFDKRDLAQIMSVSISYIDKSIARGFGIPNYKKLGTGKSSKVVFNVIDVATYLAQTIKTL